jgi:hypothetical protein
MRPGCEHGMGTSASLARMPRSDERSAVRDWTVDSEAVLADVLGDESRTIGSHDGCTGLHNIARCLRRWCCCNHG